MSSSLMLRFLVGLAVVAFVWGVYEIGSAARFDNTKVGPVAAESALATGAATEAPADYPIERGDTVVDDVNVLRQEVVRLRTDLAALQAQMRVTQSTRGVAGAAPASVAEGTAFGGELSEEELKAQEVEAAARDHQRSLARMQAYEASLRAESIDAAWSNEAVDALKEAFTSQELSATGLQDIECRATLCRIEVVHADEEKRREFERTFVEKVAPVLPSAVMHTEEHEDGSSATTVYLARQGHQLPRVQTSDSEVPSPLAGRTD
jgi:hypothetical protein